MLVGTPSPDGHTEEELRNLETIRRLRGVPAARRREFMTRDVVIHRHGMAHLGALRGVGYDPDGIADRVDHIEDMVAKGDRVWAVWTIRGTHTGPLFGAAPTGRPLEVLEVGIWRLVDGKVAEAWFFADEYALARALGITP
ncbi:ester cyclase [Nonomuraea sp. NPDC050556]|uniref:ester cyclase n=1 Tax=Nonomuraea sp. NPDC050556 TaxID=3364369 RepID=UPI0037BD0896